MDENESRHVTIHTTDGRETTFLLDDDQLDRLYRDWENRAYSLLEVSGCLTGSLYAVHKIVKAHIIKIVESDHI